MKNLKKLVSLALAVCLTLSLTACGGSKSTADSSQSTGGSSADAAQPGSETASELERVDLVFYLMGDAPTDEVLVEEQLNALLLEKLNCTVDLQFSTWTDFQQKYSLELTSGSADLIYVANWLNYGLMAASGAFEELDDLMANYGPNLQTIVDEGKLNACRVGGSLYAIPGTWDEYVSNGIKYREDLRVKYDLPVPDSLENMEAFFLGIKENEPNQPILACTTEESQGFQTGFDAAWVLNMKYPWVANNGLPYGLASDYDTPADVYDYWWSDDFVEDCKMLKRWAEYGFWSRSALSDGNNADSYVNGLCVAEVAGQNPGKQVTGVATFRDQHPDWTSEYLPFGMVTGVMYPGHATQNGTAIVRGSKNPERAMMLIDLIMSDEEVYRALHYGIEGTHYEVVEGKDYNYNDLTKGMTPDDFGFEGANTWGMRNGDLRMLTEDSVLMESMFDEYDAVAGKTKFPYANIFDGFTENYEAYAAERSAVSNVIKQYLAPLQAGLVTDVDASVEEFRGKMTEAGLEKVRDGFKTQWAAYCEEYGYK